MLRLRAESVRHPPGLGYPAGPHPRIWPTAEPGRRDLGPATPGGVRSERGVPRPSEDQYPQEPLSASKTFPRTSSGGNVGSDLLVDQLDQLGAEPECALEGGALDPVGRVAVAVQLGRVV